VFRLFAVNIKKNFPKMKTLNLIILGVLLLQCKLFAGGIIPVSRWKIHEIRIDGNDSDWHKPINFYDVKTGLFFAITNDSTTLFLNFTATDQQKLQNLINGGWTLGFVAKNKKSNTKASLTFAPSHSAGGMHNRMGMDEKLNFGAQNRPGKKSELPRQLSDDEISDAPVQSLGDNRKIVDYSHNLRSFQAKGFIFTHGEVPIRESKAIFIGVGKSDPAGLLYEIAIPLGELFEENSLRLNELITMVVTVNASGQEDGQMNRPQQWGRPDSMPGGGGPGGMSGGGPGGGGMGGGMRGGQMPGGGRSALAQGSGDSSSGKVVFKQKFRLASH